MSEDQKLAALAITTVALAALYTKDILRVKRATRRIDRKLAKPILIDYAPLFQFQQ
jgi:hypothetical protein